MHAARYMPSNTRQPLPLYLACFDFHDAADMPPMRRAMYHYAMYWLLKKSRRKFNG